VTTTKADLCSDVDMVRVVVITHPGGIGCLVKDWRTASGAIASSDSL
jgi:hypothetical protein